MRVAVIGAGAAGLCCARHLSKYPETFSTQVFEKSAMVGGTWVYSDFTGEDEFGHLTHSSMYKNLRHYFSPYVPSIPGLESFPGSVIHSHNYRNPEKYRGQDVLVIGAGSSGHDIVGDLSGSASTVFMCTHGKVLEWRHPPNIELVPDVESVDSGGTVYFIGGKKQRVDSIVVCTGYCYEFLFLGSECGIEVVGRRVIGLFKHTFNAHHPSMAFIGLNLRVLPFPYFDLQVQWVLAVWRRVKPLPSTQEMLLDSDEDYQQRLAKGMPPHYAHFLGPAQWDFYQELAELGGSEPLSPVLESLYTHVYTLRRQDLSDYKKTEFAVVDDKEWVQVKQTPSE